MTSVPGSVRELIEPLVELALRDSGFDRIYQRGNLHLNIEVCLGDHGEYLWDTRSLYFTPKRHMKDFSTASRERNGKQVD